jgi:hypothetical protein
LIIVNQPTAKIESFDAFLQSVTNYKMRLLVFCLLLTILTACSSKRVELKQGVWRGVLELQGQQLAFGLEIWQTNNQWQAAVVNAGEKIILDEVYRGRRFYPHYHAYFRFGTTCKNQRRETYRLFH